MQINPNGFYAVVIAFSIAGCGALNCPQPTPAPTPKSQVIDKSCDMYITVTPRKGDVFTNETAQQILKNNDKFAEHCNQKS